MTANRAGIAAVLLSSAPFLAAVASETLDSSQEARFMDGTHQFYVWCTGADDFTVAQAGETAEAAQKALLAALKADGRSTCWPVWQGRVKAGK